MNRAVSMAVLPIDNDGHGEANTNAPKHIRRAWRTIVLLPYVVWMTLSSIRRGQRGLRIF